MKNEEICGVLLSIRECVEHIKVSGRNDCAAVVACCNTVDRTVESLRQEAEE